MPAMIPSDAIEVPGAWEHLPIAELHGLIMVIGAADVGKSTFTQYLARRVAESGVTVAELDGDPGQSRLGPPATISLALYTADEVQHPDRVATRRMFIGSVTPSGHMLPVLVGAVRLVEAAWAQGAAAIVYDTSGFLDPARGGYALKLAKVNLLKPNWVIAIQRQGELEDFLRPLRGSQRCRVLDLKPALAVSRREMVERQAYRVRRFARYFAGAREIDLAWDALPVFPTPGFSPERLLAFEDQEGFTLGLGIVTASDPARHIVAILTPLPSLQGVSALVLGDICVEIQTYRDYRMERT